MRVSAYPLQQNDGGVTSFNGLVPRYDTRFTGQWYIKQDPSYNSAYVALDGGGLGGGHASPAVDESLNGTFYGAGGGIFFGRNTSGVVINTQLGDGKQGAVYVRWHDPARAAGPLPQPALFSARRMAARLAEPVTVNLYDPATGRGSVWLEEDAEAKLAEGLITQEAWQEMCAARAAEEYAAWRIDPDTGAERFEMLRAARDAKLAATDYLVAPDYPLTDEQRAGVTAYRQALRDLPAQEGAPWDGGGELTPWPLAPVAGLPCA